ncbi:hypothetical protein H5410_058265 [Solanum commersonii]|uniref:Uncharacterized protein n=1 Tax=Solanum commersonii TaxID=4109 RepID=A0A9J5WQ91_SOLCO|nr:hypothetical protein H5410_058265 [Solanum commersonii]
MEHHLGKLYVHFESMHIEDEKRVKSAAPKVKSLSNFVENHEASSSNLRGDKNTRCPFGVTQWFGLETSMLEVSSSKPPASESKGSGRKMEPLEVIRPEYSRRRKVCTLQKIKNDRLIRKRPNC